MTYSLVLSSVFLYYGDAMAVQWTALDLTHCKYGQSLPGMRAHEHIYIYIPFEI